MRTPMLPVPSVEENIASKCSLLSGEGSANSPKFENRDIGGEGLLLPKRFVFEQTVYSYGTSKNLVHIVSYYVLWVTISNPKHETVSFQK
jgi:hypothetical protein